jgi:uncharacterized membrane protein
MLALAPLLIAAALATFAGEHFTQASEFSQLVPKWLGLRVPITYLVGVCLLAAALSFVARRYMRWSAPLLALLFALFVLLIYLPSAITHPGIRIVWIFPFREGTFAVGAFCVFLYEAQRARIGLFVPDLFLAEGVSQRVTAINFVADTLLFAGMMFAIARVIAAQL